MVVCVWSCVWWSHPTPPLCQLSPLILSSKCEGLPVILVSWFRLPKSSGFVFSLVEIKSFFFFFFPPLFLFVKVEVCNFATRSDSSAECERTLFLKQLSFSSWTEPQSFHTNLQLLSQKNKKKREKEEKNGLFIGSTNVVSISVIYMLEFGPELKIPLLTKRILVKCFLYYL